jgi:UDP-glucose 4-epimerase
MTKVLVTGGAGYIGSNVCKVLLQNGHKVRVFDDFSNGLERRLTGMNVEIVRGDTLDRLAIIDAMKNINAVIHLAGKKSVEESVENPLKYYSNNFAGTLNVLAAMAIHKVRKIVFSSTAVVYESINRDALREDDPKNPLSPYAASKLLSEEVLALSLQAEGISSVSLRYFNVVGAGGANLGDNARDNLVPKTFKALRSGGTPEIYGNDYRTHDGTCIRDYIHVVDLAEAHKLSLDLMDKRSAAAIFNVGSGTGYTVKEMMNQMRETTGIEFEAKIMPRRSGDPEKLVADVSKIKKELGWKPTSTLKEMIDSSWEAEKASA